MKNISSGFTLVELMVVVAIISILASIAIPSYQDFLIRGRIPDATSVLATKRTQIEQFFQDNRTYVGAAACVADNTSGQYFDFSCPIATATAYTIQAAGKKSMASFTYTIDQDNTKITTIAAGGPSGWVGNASCWVTRKGGAC